MDCAEEKHSNGGIRSPSFRFDKIVTNYDRYVYAVLSSSLVSHFEFDVGLYTSVSYLTADCALLLFSPGHTKVHF